MAYQGILAYFYDQLHPKSSVELDVCRWNQVIADVIWRGPNGPQEHVGECRDYPSPGVAHKDNTPTKGQCHDCRILPVDQTMTVHYTACKKPWECTIPTPRIPAARNKAHTYRLQELTNVTTCKLLFREYFAFRRDVELKIAEATKASTKIKSPKGSFHPDAFLGYCKNSRQYIPMELPDGFSMRQAYGF